jgi:phosphohistidine phosphatase SixA
VAESADLIGPASAMTKLLRLLWILLGCGAASAVAASDELWKRVATEPGIVVLLRNANAAGGSPAQWDESGRCQGEMMLTDAGKALAKRIGDAFASRGIRPTVISSPMCRSRDTAQIAFGGGHISDAALRDLVSADADRTRAFERMAQTLIARQRGSRPVVFVSHKPNIDAITMELIEIGELLVTRVDDQGRIDVLGRISFR